MPRLQKIVTIFDDDGSGAPRIIRDYKVVDGIEIDIAPEDRVNLYSDANANGAEAIGAASVALAKAESERDAALAQVAALRARD